MTSLSALNQLPLWAFGLLTLTLLLGSLEFGFLLGRRNEEREEGSGQLTTLQAATLGLLALVLSFTYSYVSDRLDMRKLAVINEANAIGTAYLRAGYIPGPQGDRIRTLLKEYARIRMVTPESAGTTEKVQKIVSKSEELHNQIWSAVEKIMAGDAGPREVTLVQAVNDVIDLHTVRLTVSLDRLPDIVMSMLLLIAVMSMFLTGYNASISGTRSRWITFALASLLAFLVFMIADLDRSLQGFVRVSQAPYLSLIQSMDQ